MPTFVAGTELGWIRRKTEIASKDVRGRDNSTWTRCWTAWNPTGETCDIVGADGSDGG